jgi:VacB/RNase II family 3'-5' exoribonuclease
VTIASPRASKGPFTAQLLRPSGAGPSPAIVALHGCSGLLNSKGHLRSRELDWANRFLEAGYVVLFADSFTARGQREICTARERTIFPKDVEREVAALPRDPATKDFADRWDLRNEIIYTIDGEDAQDYDDAISAKELGDGKVEVGVHIADVAHYVRPGTALDDEALARGTSVYLADQVIPMLPEALSNHLCSLVGGRERLAYSVLMVFDAKGERLSARVGKSVIRSARRNTYKEVQELLDGADTPARRELARACVRAFDLRRRRALRRQRRHSRKPEPCC